MDETIPGDDVVLKEVGPWAQRSYDITKLAVALSKAQSEISVAVKDSTNPHFQHDYADLASVWAAIRVPLTKNGLSVVQEPMTHVADDHLVVFVATTLLHESGQYIRSVLGVPVAMNATGQVIGSATTYARRYSLMAVVGVAPADDDGNAASEKRAEKPKAKPKPKPKPAEKPAEKPKPNPSAITPAQRRRLFDQATAKGWTPETLKAHLASLDIQDTKRIKPDQYLDIMASIDAGPPT